MRVKSEERITELDQEEFPALKLEAHNGLFKPTKTTSSVLANHEKLRSINEEKQKNFDFRDIQVAKTKISTLFRLQLYLSEEIQTEQVKNYLLDIYSEAIENVLQQQESLSESKRFQYSEKQSEQKEPVCQTIGSMFESQSLSSASSSEIVQDQVINATLQQQNRFQAIQNQGIRDFQQVNIRRRSTMKDSRSRSLGIDEIILEKKIILVGKSLFILTEKNRFRNFMRDLLQKKYFDNFIIVLILISTVNLAVETPMDNPASKKIQVLAYIDYVTTGMFSIEMLSKIVVYGFVLNGKESYLRVGWNILDFLVVIAALFSFLPLKGSSLKTLKAFRIFRILRPLRMIQRFNALKNATNALVQSLPEILKLNVPILFFMLLFSQLHTTLFGGLFWHCHTNHLSSLSYKQVQMNIDTKWDCINYGGEWINQDYNFETIISSLATLFSIQSTEGWNDPVMWLQADVTTYDHVPKRFNSIYYILFAIVIEVFTNLIFMNLFVGAVIHSFHSKKSKIEGLNMLTPLKLKWISTQILGIQSQPQLKIDVSENFSDFRNFAIKIVKHKFFEYFIMSCIVLNTFTLGITWYGEPQIVTKITTNINYALVGVYTFDCIIKLVALRKFYFKNSWNVFDFIVIIITLTTLLLKIVHIQKLAKNTSFLRTVRVLRIVMLMRSLKLVRVIINSIRDSFSSLISIGMLLFVLIFIYSIIGMKLFGLANITSPAHSTISYHCNFKNFFNAFLLLLRCSTGESWDSMMFDYSRKNSILFQCSQNQNYDDLVSANMKTNKYGTRLSYAFFVSYTILVNQIFLNIFIALIIDSFIGQSKKAQLPVQEIDIDQFVEFWADYDNFAKGHIRCNQIQLLIDRLIEAGNQLIPANEDRNYSLNKLKFLPIFYDWSETEPKNLAHIQYQTLLLELLRFKFADSELKEKTKPKSEEEQRIKTMLADKKFLWIHKFLKNSLKKQEEIIQEAQANLMDLTQTAKGVSFESRQIQLLLDLTTRRNQANKLLKNEIYKQKEKKDKHFDRDYDSYFKLIQSLTLSKQNLFRSQKSNKPVIQENVKQFGKFEKGVYFYKVLNQERVLEHYFSANKIGNWWRQVLDIRYARQNEHE